MIKTKGFTLYELLITLAIIAILTSTAIPSFSSIIKSSRSQDLYNNIFTLIQYTRSTAVFLAEDVILCPTTDKENCDQDWTQPLIIFVDSNKNKTRDKNEIINHTVTLLNNNEKFIWRASASRRYIRFISDGSTSNQSGNFTICISDPQIKYIQRIILYRSGRARKARENEIKESHCQ